MSAFQWRYEVVKMPSGYYMLRRVSTDSRPDPFSYSSRLNGEQYFTRFFAVRALRRLMRRAARREQVVHVEYADGP